MSKMPDEIRHMLDEIQKRDIKVMEKKRHDYGTDNINGCGVYGVAVRLFDKVHRFKNLTHPGSPGPEVDEDLFETLLDIRNYGKIAEVILRRGEW